MASKTLTVSRVIEIAAIYIQDLNLTDTDMRYNTAVEILGFLLSCKNLDLTKIPGHEDRQTFIDTLTKQINAAKAKG